MKNLSNLPPRSRIPHQHHPITPRQSFLRHPNPRSARGDCTSLLKISWTTRDEFRNTHVVAPKSTLNMYIAHLLGPFACHMSWVSGSIMWHMPQYRQPALWHRRICVPGLWTKDQSYQYNCCYKGHTVGLLIELTIILAAFSCKARPEAQNFSPRFQNTQAIGQQ